MATTRTTRPVSKLAGATRVTAKTGAKFSRFKPTAEKATVAKSAITLKRKEAAKRQARISARAKTKAETNRRRSP